jgi:zinc protease
MKNIFAFLSLILSFWTNLAFAAIPQVAEVESAGGYKAWIIEDSYLPIVSIKIAFTKSGNAYDPAGKNGLAYMLSGLLDEGAGGMSSFEYRKKLEELAISIAFDVDDDNFYVLVQTLKENLDQSMQLINLALTKPNLNPDIIERIRNQILVIIQQQQEDPEYIATRKLDEAMFGNHPYGGTKQGNLDSIKSIKRENLQGFIENNFTKENIVISIVGDVTKKQVAKLLDKHLTIPTKEHKTSPLPAVNISDTGQEINVEKSIPQSIILFAGKGVKRSDKDFYPFYLMNHILGGGGFESRLMDTVREKNGLAYSVSSYLDLYNQAGIFSGSAGTDGTKMKKTISLIKDELRKMQQKGVTDKELADAKDYLINSFPLKMTKNEKLAEFLSVMQTENLGIDFLQKRNDDVRGVTKEQIQDVASRLLDVDKMTFVVVGSK